MGWFRRTKEEAASEAVAPTKDPTRSSGVVPRGQGHARDRSTATTLSPGEGVGGETIDAEVYDLVLRAELIAIVSPVESLVRQENGNIVTHTRVHIERHIAGRSARRLECIRTRGGTLGAVARFYDGEASFVAPVRSLVFLVGGQILEVAAGARGQFPIVCRNSKKAELIVSPWRSILAPPRSEIPSPFGSRTLDEVVADLADAWSRLHI